MLDYLSLWNDIESNDVCSLFKISLSVNCYYSVQILLFETLISLIYQLHKKICVIFLSGVDEIVAYIFFEQFKAQGCSIETKKWWGSCNFSIKKIHVIHDVLFWISFNKRNCSSSRESWFWAFNDVLSGN